MLVLTRWRQVISNFGQRAPASQLELLRSLQARGLIDELVEYAPRSDFTAAEKRAMVSPISTGFDLGGARAEEVADQFFNEMLKREEGRRRCLAAGCRFFMSMDCDECYLAEPLRRVVERMESGGYECAICRMRYYFVDPRWELRPQDELNCVTAVFRCSEHMPFRIGCPYPFLIDPTRKLHNVVRLLELSRDELEMHHYSFVRESLASKLLNVSNRSNYGSTADSLDAVRALASWDPRLPLVHPHLALRDQYRSVAIVPNLFGIRITAMKSHPDLPVGSIFTEGKPSGRDTLPALPKVATLTTEPAMATSVVMPAPEAAP